MIQNDEIRLRHGHENTSHHIDKTGKTITLEVNQTGIRVSKGR